MAIQKNANLDISVAAEQNPNYNMKPSVQFSTQDRNTAKYTFTVKQDNKAVDLTGVTATVTLYMADKSIFQNNATVTNAKEGEIEYTIPPDAIRHHGSAKGELKLTYANGDALGGLRFSFAIEQSLIDKADGVLKEVYIEDFQAISNAVNKKAEEVTVNLERLDEEYQNKAYTVDEKLADVQATVNDLRENGTGIDVQARDDIQNTENKILLYINTESEFIQTVRNIKNAIKTLMTNKVKIVFQAGTYTFNETIVIPPFMRIGVNGIVVVKYTGTGTLFHIKYDHSLVDVNQYTNGFNQNPLHNGNVIDGSDGALILKGSGKENNQTAFRFGDETLTQSTHRKHLAWTHFSNFYIESFGTAFSFTQKENYIMTFNNATVSHCGKIIKDEGNAVNSGEEVRWNKCNFHNSDLFLELNSEINHVFDACSIDYNAAGVTINNDKYATIRFINCWIEGSNTPGTHPFIKSNNTNARNVIVIMLGGYIFPKEKISDTIFSGKFKLIYKDTFLFINRYSAEKQNIGAGAMLCDDDVIVISTSGSSFQEQPAVISRNQALNVNSNFEIDAIGSAIVTGFIKGSVAGEAGVVIDDSRKFSGSKSLKIDTLSGSKTFVNLTTEKVPLRNAERILGQARLFLTTAKTYGITTVVTFYGEDKTTIIDTLSLPQNITTTTANKWVALPTGAYYEKPIPPKAMYADFKLTVGSLASDIWIDDMILAYY